MKKIFLISVFIITSLCNQLFCMEADLGNNLQTLVMTLEEINNHLEKIPQPPAEKPTLQEVIAQELNKITQIAPEKIPSIIKKLTDILGFLPPLQVQAALINLITNVQEFAEKIINADQFKQNIKNVIPNAPDDVINSLAQELKGKEKVEEEPEEPTIIKAPINWNLYVPLQESSFSKDPTVRYPSHDILTAINTMRQLLDSVSIVRKGEAYNYTDLETTGRKIQEITDELVKTLESAPQLDPKTIITKDTIDNFTSLLFAMLEVMPLEPIVDITQSIQKQNIPTLDRVLHNIIQLFSLINFDKVPSLSSEEKNYYAPGRILSLLAHGYAGNAVLSVQNTIEQERLETLKIKVSGRKAHLEFLAQKFSQAISRIYALLKLHKELTQDPYNLSLLDQDLFFFNIICNWNSIENMFKTLKNILTEKEYSDFLDLMVSTLDPFPSAIDYYFNEVKTSVQQAIENHPRPIISQFDVLEYFNDRIKNETPEKLKLPRFILQYIPQKIEFTLQAGKINEEIVKSLWNSSLYQRFIACNNAHLKDKSQFEATLGNLKKAINAYPKLVPLLNNVQESIKTYDAKITERETLDALLIEISDNPEIASDTKKIDEKIKTIKAMDLTVEEIENIAATLEQRKQVVEQGKKLAEELSKQLCITCEGGNEPKIKQQIDNFLNESHEYNNIQLQGKVLKDDDKNNAQRIILESIIAHLLTDTFYHGNEEGKCYLCAFTAAFILAQDIQNRFETHNPYILAVINFHKSIRKYPPYPDTPEFYDLDYFKEFFKKFFSKK